MAVFGSTNTGVTEMDLILAIVQEELTRTAKLAPTVMDMSGSVEPGVKQLEIPRYDGAFADPESQPDDGAVTAQSFDFAVDTLALDDYRTLAWELPDRVTIQSRMPIEAELAASAGRRFANYLDDKIIERLKAAADGTGGLPDHIIQLSGTDLDANANQAITLADITKARELLNKANVPAEDRFMIVSPKQEREMLNISNFIKADEYGSREALLNGEIGRVYDFRVMVHNGLADNEVIAYQRGAVAYASQKNLRFETRRSDLKRQKTEYAFSAGWGYVTLEQGVKQVLINATGT